MIKSTHTPQDKVDEKPTFPALYRAKAESYVVLFRSEFSGTVVFESLGGWNLGHHTDRWVSCFDAGAWTLLEPGESIILAVE